MSITIHSVTTRDQLRRFIYLPETLYQNDPHWVAPLYSDEWNFHNPATNAALAYSDTICFLAEQDGNYVGRIMGIINHQYNERIGERTARFYNLDCVNDLEVAKALLNRVEQWAREKGMNKVIGPYGFSDKDPQGLQIEGFEHLPVIATPTNPAYLQNLVEQLGYSKVIDCVSYTMPVSAQTPELYQKIAARALSDKKIRLLEFTSKKQLKPYIVPVFRLVNECYAPLFGFVPMSEEEMKRFAAQYLPVLDPAFVKVIVDDADNVISFVVAMPDMSVGFKKAKGRLFPFGFVHLLLSAKRTTQLDLLLGAVKSSYRTRGLTAVLADSLLRSARSRGLVSMDSHLILETNTRMRAECERIGGQVYKRYRVLGKNLS